MKTNHESVINSNQNLIVTTKQSDNRKSTISLADV